ncbi:DUF2332 domain-containing protein [Glaciihabitans arcticus]|uniref:DUF2332 domain-containing protein n=1 Tax=Glaciihabitans arcticus TaxID=2668039 RepID=A0A4Q9GSG5_9MICO|nr:DUF2332 domain-containing protein [Glaciihabitans arcticus]TBN57601.1 DUF2332 domain-containing protein [Glaciihabitans arcticus]
MSETADWYTRFATLEAHGQSAIYEEWAHGVAADPALLELIEQLPRLRRQPNLIFGVSRFLGAPVGPYGPWRDWTVAHWTSVYNDALVRLTQTNEARRCAVLLAALARIPGPLALLEVGASAGLCLFPDRYSYRFGDGELLHPLDGPSAVLLECDSSGPIIERMPRVAWRAGIDLNPLDVNSAEDSRWLETLVWPEQAERRARLLAAMDIVRADPPLLVRGDATDALAELAAQAPADATLVVMTSGTLVYLVRAERDRFASAVGALGARWVSLEAAGLFPALADQVVAARGPQLDGKFALSLDDDVLALAGPHGQFLDWL